MEITESFLSDRCKKALYELIQVINEYDIECLVFAGYHIIREDKVEWEVKDPEGRLIGLILKENDWSEL